MVPPDSHQVSRGRCYSGYRRNWNHRVTGLSPSMARLSRRFVRLSSSLCGPTTPEPPKWSRFGLIRFRSPLLTESRLISVPVGTEMCHFPTFAELPPMDSEAADSGYPEPGFPIRGSSDQLVCSSPRLIAAYHALHRLSAPRHPPYTLSNLPALIRIPESCRIEWV